MTEPRFISATYHAKLQVAEFICEDGRHLLRSGGKLPWRINNCGDLKAPMAGGEPAPKKTKNYIGYAKIPDKEDTSLVHHFFIFPDYATGREQLELSLKRRYGEMTLPQMVKVYAPSHENDTSQYVKDLLSLSGLPDDLKIGAMDQAQFKSLVDAIEKREGYHNSASDRKEIWVPVSHINATDGARPLADEEVVLRLDGKDTVLKSNDVGQFKPIPHAEQPIEVLHRTAGGDLKPVGTIGGDAGQHLSLLNRVASFLGVSGPDTPPTDATSRRHPFAYPVEPKDTLGSIAKRFETTVEQIKQDNSRKGDRIFAGETVWIYGPPPTDALADRPPKKSAPRPNAPASAKTSASAPQPSAAASSTARAAPPAGQVSKQARSDAGAGKTLAIIDLDPSRTPWMAHAIAEAKRFKGDAEQKIEKEINYGAAIGTGSRSMVGTENAWCAAFAAWCLSKAGYPIDNPTLPDHGPEMGRARYFHMTKLSRELVSEEQVKVLDPKTGKERVTIKKKYKEVLGRNPLYVQLEKPIFGAIGVVYNIKRDAGEHVGFIYAEEGVSYILLGGNQGQQINFSPFAKDNGKSRMLFFVPVAYQEAAKKESNELVKTTSSALNREFGIRQSNSEGTVR